MACPRRRRGRRADYEVDVDLRHAGIPSSGWVSRSVVTDVANDVAIPGAALTASCSAQVRDPRPSQRDLCSRWCTSATSLSSAPNQA